MNVRVLQADGHSSISSLYVPTRKALEYSTNSTMCVYVCSCGFRLTTSFLSLVSTRSQLGRSRRTLRRSVVWLVTSTSPLIMFRGGTSLRVFSEGHLRPKDLDQDLTHRPKPPVGPSFAHEGVEAMIAVYPSFRTPCRIHSVPTPPVSPPVRLVF